MAMLTCAECGATASTSARRCPGCGASRRAMRRIPRPPAGRWTKLALFGLPLASAAIIAVAESNQPPKSAAQQRGEQAEGHRLTRASAAVRALRASLRDPDSLALDRILVDEGGATVCLRYRARNGFGGMNRGLLVLTGTGSRTSATAWNRHCVRSMYDYTTTLPTVIRMLG